MVDDGVSRKPKTLSETVPPPFPFDLPSNWKWTQLGRLVNVLSSKRIHAREYLKSGVPFYRSKEVGMLSRGCEPHDPHFIATSRFEEIRDEFGAPKVGDLMLTSVGSIGNFWLSDGREFYYKDGNVTQLVRHDLIDMQYVQMFVRSPIFRAAVDGSVSGTAYNALTIVKINALLFPLPPLAEQKRIVSKVTHLLSQVTRLESTLTRRESTRTQLLTAAIHSLLSGGQDDE
ncbi:MAG: restriction endonuclease subunit S [Fuerstiella sp.]